MPAPTPATLKSLEFFADLEEDELRYLAERARLTRLATGEALFVEGDPLEPMLRFVYAGGLAITRSAANGKETVLRMIRLGEMFGIAALFDRKIAPGNAIATEPSEVLEIHQADLLAHITQNPAIAMKLLVKFAERLRDVQDTLHSVMSGRAKTRLARQILKVLDYEGGIEGPDGFRLRTKLPHATLSRMVGITYEECVRLIRAWSGEPALLSYERGGVIVVRDRDKLVAEATDD